MLRILITEDDEMLIELYRSVLKHVPDISVSIARNASDSRLKISSEHFDIAFFDINLGAAGGEGIDLLEYMIASVTETIVIMMSTQDDPQTRARCRAADDFLTKNAHFVPAFMASVDGSLKQARSRSSAKAVA